jgi:hypothetical protein
MYMKNVENPIVESVMFLGDAQQFHEDEKGKWLFQISLPPYRNGSSGMRRQKSKNFLVFDNIPLDILSIEELIIKLQLISIKDDKRPWDAAH